MSRQVNPHVLIWAVALGLGAPGAALAQPTPETTPAARSVALKADALAFAVNGYSGVFRLSLAKGVGLADVAFQSVHSKVHLSEADGGCSFLLSEKGDAVAGVLAEPLDEMTRLDEHAAGTAGGIEDEAVVRLYDVDDRLHERGRREELAVVLCALHRELHQEIFVDAPEDIAARVS